MVPGQTYGLVFYNDVEDSQKIDPDPLQVQTFVRLEGVFGSWHAYFIDSVRPGSREWAAYDGTYTEDGGRPRENGNDGYGWWYGSSMEVIEFFEI